MLLTAVGRRQGLGAAVGAHLEALAFSQRVPLTKGTSPGQALGAPGHIRWAPLTRLGVQEGSEGPKTSSGFKIMMAVAVETGAWRVLPR